MIIHAEGPDFWEGRKFPNQCRFPSSSQYLGYDNFLNRMALAPAGDEPFKFLPVVGIGKKTT